MREVDQCNYGQVYGKLYLCRRSAAFSGLEKLPCITLLEVFACSVNYAKTSKQNEKIGQINPRQKKKITKNLITPKIQYDDLMQI